MLLLWYLDALLTGLGKSNSNRLLARLDFMFSSRLVMHFLADVLARFGGCCFSLRFARHIVPLLKP